MADSEVDRRLNAVIDLFRCIHERDKFLKVYEHELAQRLLNKTSIAQEHELLMILKLKMECSSLPLAKME